MSKAKSTRTAGAESAAERNRRAAFSNTSDDYLACGIPGMAVLDEHGVCITADQRFKTLSCTGNWSDPQGVNLLMLDAFAGLVGGRNSHLNQKTVRDVADQIPAVLPQCCPGSGITCRASLHDLKEHVDKGADRFVLMLHELVEGGDHTNPAWDGHAEATAILNATTEVALIVNPDGTIHAVNEAAQKRVNLSESQMLGMCVYDLFPPAIAKLRRARNQSVFDTGVPTRFSDYDPREGRWYQESCYPVFDRDGQVTRVAVFAQDVTKARRLAKEVLDISSHERSSIGQILHDSLGQMLTGVALLSTSMASDLKEERSSLVEKAEKIKQLVMESISHVRGLSRGLSPLDIKEEGLAYALQRLAEDADQIGPLRCSFSQHGALPPSLDVGTATQLYWIAHEAMTNAIRHSEGSRVDISLDTQDAQATLVIRDDGQGLAPPGHDTKGMGLRIMQYRAETIDAVLNIRTGKTGTHVHCSLDARQLLDEAGNTADKEPDVPGPSVSRD